MLFAFMHAFAKTVCGVLLQTPHKKRDFRLRTCTSRTSRTSSARFLSGFSRHPQLSSGEEGKREKPSAELGISHSHVLLIDMRDARLRDAVFAASS